MPLRRLATSAWVPMAATTIGIVAILLNSGVAAGDLGRYGLYLAGAVALPGIFAWRLLLARFHTDEDPPPTWLEDLSLGTIFGFGIQLPVYLVGVWLGVPLLFLVLPAVVLGISLATPGGRRVWALPAGRVDIRAAWALALVILYGVGWLARNLFFLRPLSLPPYRTPSIDETFHQALIAELAHRFPPQIPFLLGTPLDYHWFVHAQLAASSWVTRIQSDVMLRQILPATLLALTVLGLAAVGLRLTGRPLVAVVAPALLVAGGLYLTGPHYPAWEFHESYLSKRLVSSPSQTYGFMMALPAILLILEVLRPDRRASRLTWFTLALTLFALAGAKATFIPLFLCGALALWLLRLIVDRTFDRTVSGLLVLLIIAAIFAQVVLFGGNSGALSFAPFMTVESAVAAQRMADTPVTHVAMAVSLLIGWLLYGVGVVGLSRQRRWRDPRAIWMLASIPPGIVVALMFFRSGFSQLWFQRSTAELVLLLSAWGLSYLLPNPLTTRVALRLAAIVATVGLPVYAVSSYLEAGKPDRLVATFPELVYTVTVPVLIFAVYVLLRLLRNNGVRVPVPSLAVVVVCVLGIGSTHVYAFAYDTITQRGTPERIYRPLFARGGVAAATWLARHSSPDDVVATNAHCVDPRGHCDNRHFWISAYTKRRIVIEGWGYTAATNASAVPEIASARLPVPFPKRLAVNDAAFQTPSAATIRRLANRYGVSWLFVSKEYPVDLAGLSGLTDIVDRRFDNPNYAVFEVVTAAPPNSEVSGAGWTGSNAMGNTRASCEGSSWPAASVRACIRSR